jgi:hypothetical protein
LYEEGFLSYLRVERGLSTNTLTAYRNDLAKLAAFANSSGKDLVSLQADDLATFVRLLHKRGLHPRSIARALVAVRGFYRFLTQDGHLKLDPSADLEAPKAWQSLPRFLSAEEVERLLSSPITSTAIGLRDKAMLEVLYATGLRVSVHATDPDAKRAAYDEGLALAHRAVELDDDEDDDDLDLDDLGGADLRAPVGRLVEPGADDDGVEFVDEESDAVAFDAEGSDLSAEEEAVQHKPPEAEVDPHISRIQSTPPTRWSQTSIRFWGRSRF